MRKSFVLTGIVILVAASLGTFASKSPNQSSSNQESAPTERKGGQKKSRFDGYPKPVSLWEGGSFILGNPTDRSISVAVHVTQDCLGYFEYKLVGSQSTKKTISSSFKAGSPSQVTLAGLNPNSAYTYKFIYQVSEGGEDKESPEYRFQTQRTVGESFTFFVQGDSHPERMGKMNVPSLYERTLLAAAAQKPDFFICLGDDFSVDTLKERTPETIEGVYAKQVPYLGLVGNSAPIFLVNGNHEQAARVNTDGTANSLGVLVQNARNRNFVQPAPDGFYSGNVEKVDHIGYLRNYFAWTWGDALFITIDPYWHSQVAVDNSAGKGPGNGNKGRRDLWDITLGDKQYQWLTKTLTESKAKYKFVFAHHVHGTSRGGVELAGLYEWGGKSPNGTNDFSEKRPNWALPIHQLFVKTGVSVFFQGHDHIFCKQELDGVIYQSCPCPADPTNSLINGDAYKSGNKVPGSGLVRVSVNPNMAKVEYVRTYEPSAETDGRKHGEIAFAYEVKPGVHK